MPHWLLIPLISAAYLSVIDAALSSNSPPPKKKKRSPFPDEHLPVANEMVRKSVPCSRRHISSPDLSMRKFIHVGESTRGHNIRAANLPRNYSESNTRALLWKCEGARNPWVCCSSRFAVFFGACEPPKLRRSVRKSLGNTRRPAEENDVRQASSAHCGPRCVLSAGH